MMTVHVGTREGTEAHVGLLRASYWVAAVADFVVAILVLIPERMGTGGIVYPMALMSAVAFSWGVLLVVADRRPVERRWMLYPTALVVFLLGAAGVYGAMAGLVPVTQVLGSSTAVVLVLSLLLYTLYRTRKA